MTGLKLYNSNRLEILSEKLAELLAENPLPPLETEIIIVQNPGMARWLSLRMAASLEIWANCDYLLPDRFLWKIFRWLYPDLADKTIFEKENLTWRLMTLLAELADKPAFSTVKSYLAEGQDTSRFQLADRLAGLYNKYMLFRPEMLLAWDRKPTRGKTTEALKNEDWQRQLWQAIDGAGNQHRAALLYDSMARLNDPDFDPAILPSRISIFAISSLPPSHVRLLAELAGHVEINFFIVNPCMEYWDDIISEKDRSGIAPNEDDSDQTLYLESGNTLLASMGRLGRDFLHTLREFDSQDHEFFHDPGQASLLTTIQSDILNLSDRRPEPGSQPDKKKTIAANDLSLQVRSCHSPMRELEVLRDHLLHLFDRDAENNPAAKLQPSDILVMVPDIDLYGPLIRAVFSTLPANVPAIPFSIADQSINQENPLVRTFFTVLDLAGGRYTASRVLAILESPAIQKKFRLAAGDMETIGRWVAGSNIRWGIDRANRTRLGLPALAENTWQAGIERLLLGYAMPGRNEKTFADILPYDHIEGGDTEILGRFLDFISTLFQHLQDMERPHSLQDWSKKLLAFLQDCFQPPEDAEPEMRLLRAQLLNLAAIQANSGCQDRVELGVILSFLSKNIEEENRKYSRGHSAFLTGGLTFCAMLPMRSIPFKVICLLGMNDKSFPRQEQMLSFDLTAAPPRPGDRSQRHDDRHLFLETILSARQQLYISYIGQSVKDDSKAPPSVLVSELLDYVDSGFRLGDDSNKEILDHLLIEHRLQPFSPDYFRPDNDKQRLFSYDLDNYCSALALVGERRLPTSLLNQPLTAPADDFQQVDLDRLLNFFIHPVKFLFNKRLGIYLDREPDLATDRLDREPFYLKGLDRYLLKTELLDRELAGHDLSAYYQTKKAAGELPPGRVGAFVYRDLQADIESFTRNLEEFIQDQDLPPLKIDLTINGFNLSGQLDDLRSEGLLRYRCAKVTARDRVRVWIQHLLLNAVAKSAESPRQSILIGKDAVYRYAPLTGAKGILGELLDLYWQGLSEALPFFPRSSYIYAERILCGNKSETEAMAKADLVWSGDDYRPGSGECEDPYYRLYYKDHNPLAGGQAEEFARLALAFFKPLLAKQQSV